MTPEEIAAYYRQRIEEAGDREDSHLFQVGKTVGGVPVSEEVLSTICDAIAAGLDLSFADMVVDLGCGNGLITRRIAARCRFVRGYDLSEELLQIARDAAPDNTAFQQSDILDIDVAALDACKFFMYEVLQHFEHAAFRALLQRLAERPGGFALFVGSIPDQERIFAFYDTPDRRAYFFREVVENGNFHIGTWWYPAHIEAMCRDLGLQVKLCPQNPALHTAHYRFDALIRS